jgi:hypothetical protein
MEQAGLVIAWIGFAAIFVGTIWFLVEAFRESLLTGLAVLLLPIVWIVFLVLCWDRAKRPFLTLLGGIALILLGVLVLSAKLPFKG